jgi:hypothetical protein
MGQDERGRDGRSEHLNGSSSRTYDRAKALSAFKFGDKAFYDDPRMPLRSLILGGIIFS